MDLTGAATLSDRLKQLRHNSQARDWKILAQHIKTVLPGLKSRVSAQLTSVAKELAA